MTTRGILIIVGIFLAAFLLLGLGRCGYRKIEVFQSLEKVIVHVREEFPEVAPLDGDTLRLYLDREPAPLLVDVRRPEEYALSHLPGAVSLRSTEAIVSHLSGMERPVETIVLYGSLGLRSGPLARELSGRVDAKVFHLEGGIFRWANEGGPLVSAPGVPAGKVHPGNAIWGRLLDPGKRAEVDPGEPDPGEPGES